MEIDFECFSDLYKDENGFRPRGQWTKEAIANYMAGYEDRFEANRTREAEEFMTYVREAKGYFKQTTGHMYGHTLPVFIAPLQGEQYDGELYAMIVVYDTYAKGYLTFLDRYGEIKVDDKNYVTFDCKWHTVIKKPDFIKRLAERLGC